MKKGKTKQILIISVIAVIVILIVVGVILYFTTDLFKSNQELFYKYLAQNEEIMQILSRDNNEQNAYTLRNQSKYTTQANVNFQLTSNDPQIANQAIPPRNFSIQYAGKTDALNKKASSETTFKFLTKDLFTLKYIRNEDIHAVTSDEVINRYLAFDNNNLQEFAKKVGITEGIEQLPNKIEKVDTNAIFQFSKEEQETVMKQLKNALNSKIAKDNYTKKKNVTLTVNNKETIANEYAVTMTEKEFKEILKTILETVKNNDNILTMCLTKIGNMTTAEVTKEDVINAIDKIIEQINKLEDKDATVTVAVYEIDGQLVKTIVESSQGNKIIIDIERTANLKRAIINFGYHYQEMTEEQIPNNPDNNEYTSIEDPDAPLPNNTNSVEEMMETLKEYRIKSIEITAKNVDNETEKEYIFTVEKGDDVTKIAIQNKIVNNTQEGTLEKATMINFDFSNITYFTIKLTSKDTFVNDIAIEDLTDQNSAKANDFTPEYAQWFFPTLIQRLQQLYEQKMQVIAIVQQEENNNPINQQATNLQNEDTNTNTSSDVNQVTP